MIIRDIKELTIKRLLFVQRGLTEGTEEFYQMSDLIDSLSSSMVSVVYSREDSESRMPGAVECASELVSNNVD